MHYYNMYMYKRYIPLKYYNNITSLYDIGKSYPREAAGIIDAATVCTRSTNHLNEASEMNTANGVLFGL